MLAPQFTIRMIMVWTIAAAFIALAAVFGRRGVILAQTLVFVILVIGLSFFCFAIMFLLAQLMSQGYSSLVRSMGFVKDGQVHPQSPFADHRPPPQLVQPEEPV